MDHITDGNIIKKSVAFEKDIIIVNKYHVDEESIAMEIRREVNYESHKINQTI